MGFRRGSNRGSVTPRRRKGWDFGPGGTAVTVISASSSVFLGMFVQPTTDGLTLLRLRGMLSFYLTAAAAAADGFQGAIGIGIASAAAITAGAASVPTPITEQSADSWIFWSPISIHVPVASNLLAGVQHHVVDTKAMRKLDDTDGIYAIVELVEVGAATIQLNFDSRILFALP